jgi:hypothetical protein
VEVRRVRVRTEDYERWYGGIIIIVRREKMRSEIRVRRGLGE